MRRMLVVAAVAGSALLGSAAPTFAQTVGVTTTTNGGVGAGVSVLNQPVAGAFVSDGGTVCVGLSEEEPACV